MIRCDLCPKYLNGIFDLVRIIFAQVTVDLDVKVEGPSNVHHKFMDLNVCKECWSSISEAINKTKEQIKIKGDWS
jgi:hypothetical protein